jgi:hypothetical protein
MASKSAVDEETDEWLNFGDQLEIVRLFGLFLTVDLA